MQGLKKFEDDDNFLNYCRKYEIIAMYETWQRNINDFSSFLEGLFATIEKNSSARIRGHNCFCEGFAS